MSAPERAGGPPGPLRSIDHLGIVVASLDAATELWTRDLGLPIVVDEEGPYGRLRFLRCGESQIELIEPAAGSPLARWREREGDGLHHVAFAVDDADAALAALRNVPCARRDETTMEGSRGTRIAFLEPARASAPIVELVEHVRA